MEEGYSYKDALKTAQKEGYAELDSTFDVKGIDTAHKISLLSYLIWDEFIDFEKISIKGIDFITDKDIKIAKTSGKRYKLIGEATKEDEAIKIVVKPVLIDKNDPLYNVNDAYNGIESYGKHLEKTFFSGKGAGALPTATSIIGDLYKIKNSNAWY